MTSTSTYIPQTLARLIELYRSVTDDDSSITICDAEDDWNSSMRSCVLVGVKFDEKAGEMVGELTAEQTYPNADWRTKEETIVIPHSIIVWSGDTKVFNRRTRAMEIFSELEAVHRINNSLFEHGIDSAFGQSVDLRYMHTEDGNAVVLTWNVITRARFTIGA